MSEECTHNCSTCGDSGCSAKEQSKESLNEHSSIKKIIAITSGKGGVGKSSVTSAIAVMMSRIGYRVGILDADITGPSIPRAFGLEPGHVQGNDNFMLPNITKTGIRIMSLNLLVQNETDAVAWRGPIITNTVKQFYTDVIWDDLDFLFIDMPPGTGDVALTVFQSIPLDGLIFVTSPQDLVSMVVEKGMNLSAKMQVKALGIVENYAYFLCPDNNKKYAIFGNSKIKDICEKHHVDLLGQLRINPEFASLVDSGKVEDMDVSEYVSIAEMLMKMLPMEDECSCCGDCCDGCDDCGE